MPKHRLPRHRFLVAGRKASRAGRINSRLGLSYGQVVALFQTALGLTVSRGGVCQALARLARVAEPTYRGLIERVRGSPVVAPDETSWKVGGRLNWLWVFVSAEVTVYAIQPGRGFEQAAAILSAEFSGVLERDGWAPYRGFEQAEHQTCLDHLLRRCRNLLEGAERGQARFPHAVRRVLLAALDLRDRFAARQISPHGLAVARGRLMARMERTLAGRITHPPNRHFARHLSRELHRSLKLGSREQTQQLPEDARDAYHSILPVAALRAAVDIHNSAMMP